MKNKIKLGILISCLTYSLIGNCTLLQKKMITYGVVKSEKVSTSVSLGEGLVNKINKRVGDQVRAGQALMEIFEKERIRVYKSTINGYVAKVHANQGAAISPGMALVTVVDSKNKKIELMLSPDESRKIKINNKVYNAKTGNLNSIVTKISPIVDPETGGVLVTLKMLINIKEKIGEVITLKIELDSVKCDKVVNFKDLGKYIEEYSVDFVTDEKACLYSNKVKK
jgi:hypothetical protein